VIGRALLLSSALILPWAGPDGAIGPIWREQRYAGRTQYAPVEERGATVIRAVSEGQNSALLTRVAIDPRGTRLRWRWRVLQHPAHADPEVRARDDRAAAVIVIVHRSLFPWRTRALMYHWTPAQPIGRWSHSPYSGQVPTLVVENAPADSLWRAVERDLEADLTRAFGTHQRRIVAVGVICDGDNTGAKAVAEFGALEIVTGDAAGVPPR